MGIALVTDANTGTRRSEGADSHAFTATPRYRAYVLAILVATGICSWVDRNVFAVLLNSVKQDFGLSDTQLGLLGGVAFGVFYATAGLPIAWLADRYPRRLLLPAALALWSLMTAMCGAANGFLSLFLARIGVGVGEAGGAPPSQSLVSDYFPPARRGFALAVLYLYVPLGYLIGFLAGGWLDQTFGWRTAFMVVGLPGILLAVIVRLTLREPPRGYSENITDRGSTPALWVTLRDFWRVPSLRHLPLAGAVHGIGAFAAALWLPSYLVRVYDFSSAQAGAWLAVAYGCGGSAGVLAGGYLADRVVRRTGDPRWYAWGSAAVLLASLPCSLAMYLTDTLAIMGVAMIATTVLGHTFLGPVTAMVQGLAGVRRRAVAAALYLLLVNLVSMSVGPVAVGVASDALTQRLGTDALRYALLTIVVSTCLWSAWHFRLAARTLPDDLANVT